MDSGNKTGRAGLDREEARPGWIPRGQAGQVDSVKKAGRAGLDREEAVPGWIPLDLGIPVCLLTLLTYLRYLLYLLGRNRDLRPRRFVKENRPGRAGLERNRDLIPSRFGKENRPGRVG